MNQRTLLDNVRAIEIGGITVEVECDCSNILNWLEFDFGAFITTSGITQAQVKLSVLIQDPEKYPLPPLKETMRGPQFVAFDNRLTRYIKYVKDGALVVYDYQRDEGKVISDNEETAYEHLYLTCLSRIGEKLDLKGIHRVHALAVSCNDRAHLFLMPPGTGKSTLAFSLLKNGSVGLLSDDAPLIDQKGRVLPFLFRLGIEDGRLIADIPQAFKRISHSGDKTKTLVRADYFKQQTSNAAAIPKKIFVGFWTTSEHPQLVPAGKMSAVAFLFRDCVIGLGLPQVAEIFLRKEDIHRKIMIAFSRLRAALTMAMRCQCYKVYLSQDPQKNADLILPLLLEK